MDPHCISGGHIISKCNHGSAMYLSETMLRVICILSMGMPISVMI
jgi:hypothetical protein